MNPDYKNWVPKGILYVLAFFAFLCYVVTFSLQRLLQTGTKRVLLSSFFLISAVILTAIFLWMARMYRAFSYEGKRKLSKGVVEGLADYVEVPDNGSVLDVGCGSGALSIAVAKKNPTANVMGIDRWGKEYASYSKNLCEENARAENVFNVQFTEGDAINLNFPDESFDAVTSNYVYHNITGVNRQKLLLETLRLVKKGGSFAIHDIFSRGKYGDMETFICNLRDMGYRDVRLVDTTDGIFMTKREAAIYSLRHSAILCGKK